MSYRRYLLGPHWAEVRTRWRSDPDTPKACVVCGEARYQLHHRHYPESLAAVELTDLVALCDPHHRALHRAYERSPAMDLAAFTNAWIGVLRGQHPNPRRPPWPWPPLSSPSRDSQQSSPSTPSARPIAASTAWPTGARASDGGR
jgi:hypothetical protein